MRWGLTEMVEGEGGTSMQMGFLIARLLWQS